GVRVRLCTRAGAGWAPLRGPKTPGDPAGVTAMALSPDGALLATAGPGAGGRTELRLWDTASGELRSSISGYHAPVTALAFSADGLILASAHCEPRHTSEEEVDPPFVRLWNVSRNGSARLKTSLVETGRVARLRFSPDGRALAAWSDGPGDSRVAFWDLRDERAYFP